MIKSQYYFIFLLLFSFLFSSCNVGLTTRKALRTTSFMPDKVEMHMTLEDFESLGEAEVSISFNRYFGFVTILNEINGKEVAKRNVNSIQTYGRSWMHIGYNLEKALYDAQIKIPEAEIFIPVSIIIEQQKMFLGSKTKKTLKVRAYKLKHEEKL